MIREIQLRVEPQYAYNEQVLKETVAKECACDKRTINAVRVLKKSIDARQRTIYVNLTLRVFVNEEPPQDEFVSISYPMVDDKPQVIVVGAGPGGLFAALHLIELGYRPIVIERGKNVHERKVDIADITRTHKIDPESNYSFGEGGAGAYSDGKLYTRSNSLTVCNITTDTDVADICRRRNTVSSRRLMVAESIASVCVPEDLSFLRHQDRSRLL